MRVNVRTSQWHKNRSFLNPTHGGAVNISDSRGCYKKKAFSSLNLASFRCFCLPEFYKTKFKSEGRSRNISSR